MFYPFLCGTSHHHQEEEEEDGEFRIRPVSTPRKSRRRRRKDSKNPYSTRGLDQFSALVTELEEKRQQIYSQMGTKSMVRFLYKNSNDCVPVVVKLKDKKVEKIRPGSTTNNHQPRRVVSQVIDKKLQTPSESDQKIEKKKRFSWNVELESLRRPSHYIPIVIILILVSLVCFGRSVAILCTCISWYIVPIISEEGSNFRTSAKKKNYVRKLSENTSVSGKLSSPSVFG